MHRISATSFAFAAFCVFAWVEAFHLLHMQVIMPGSVLSVVSAYSLGISLWLLQKPGPKLVLSIVAVISFAAFVATLSSNTFLLTTIVALTIIALAFISHDLWQARIVRIFDDTASNVGVRIFQGRE